MKLDENERKNKKLWEEIGIKQAHLKAYGGLLESLDEGKPFRISSNQFSVIISDKSLENMERFMGDRYKSDGAEKIKQSMVEYLQSCMFELERQIKDLRRIAN